MSDQESKGVQSNIMFDKEKHPILTSEKLEIGEFFVIFALKYKMIHGWKTSETALGETRDTQCQHSNLGMVWKC